jgi:hypothetical protein
MFQDNQGLFRERSMKLLGVCGASGSEALWLPNGLYAIRDD